ncbi:MAG: AraD1 family protein [Planctomyces sp.]
MLQLVQFFVPAFGRRVGLLRNNRVIDLTSVNPKISTVFSLAQEAFFRNISVGDLAESYAASCSGPDYSWLELSSGPLSSEHLHLLPPFDHPEPSRLLITGTGLTHLGSVKSRDQMHGGAQTPEPATDSARMFAMGLQGGRPEPGARGVSPEWFYKGNGNSLKGPGAELEIPEYALDGGEEPEIAGCYLIDPGGRPRRLGFVLANEWSDHATEKINYLYLAPSKLRSCSIGPTLQVTEEFAEVRLRCTVTRGDQVIYDSGDLWSGEQHMCHSLRNLEDHHFKYASHRTPGDAHVHFFGTSQLSFSTRNWKYQTGDVIRIESPGFSEPLTNVVHQEKADSVPIGIVTPA